MSFATFGCVLVLLLGTALPAVAQTTLELETVRLTLRPAAAPARALQYRLLPDSKDSTPGNAVQAYYRAFSPEWTSWYQRDKLGEKVYEWMDLPLAELPHPEADFLLESAQLREVDRGARRSYVDWEMNDRQRAEGAWLLLPDIQALRMFAVCLAARARLEMANGDFDKSLYTMQTGLALGRHLQEAPNLISSLVGVSISAVTLKQVEDLMQTPGSPNLYWALTDLPRPFIDLRKAMQGEQLLFENAFGDVTALERGPVSPAELNKIVDRFLDNLNLVQGDDTGFLNGKVGARLTLVAMSVRCYPAARRHLLSQGRTEAEIDAMPVLQAVLLWSHHEYARLLDGYLKWQTFPYWQARAGLEQAEAELKASILRYDTLPFAQLLLPATNAALWSSTKLDRRIAAMRCIEALRLYAAAHDGQWPAKLSDIQEVPIPIDPATGRDFEYHLEGDKATLYGPPPKEGQPPAVYGLKFELTLAPK